MKHRLNNIILLVILLVTFFYHYSGLNELVDNDETTYAYVAKQIIHGKLLYKEVWDHKPPLIYLIYATVLNIFTPTIKTIRIFRIFVDLLTLILLYLLTKKLSDSVTAIIASVLFGFYSGNVTLQGYTANCEPFMNFFIILSLVCFIYRKEHKCGIITSGLAGGTAFLIKQTGGVVLPIICLFLLRQGFKNKNQKKYIQEGILYLLSFLTPFLLALLYFTIKGALRDFFICIYAYNIYYIKMVITSITIEYYLPKILGQTFILWIFSLIATIKLFLKQYREDIAWLILSWLLFSLLGVYIGKKYFPHYYLQLLPAMSVLAALGMKTFVIWFNKKQYMGIIFIILLIAIQLIYIQRDTKSFVRFGYTDTKPWLKSCGQYLNQHTPLDETIYVWGIDTELYLLARRDCPSRYFYYHPILINSSEEKKNVIAETLENFRQKPPFYFINDSSLYCLPNLLYEFLVENYIWDKNIGPIELYKRKDKI